MTTLRAALVTPLSGPLATYGAAGAAALGLWAERAAHLPPPWTTVTLDAINAHPSAAAAMAEVSVKRPDVVFGPYGSGAAVAALRATDRLVWNHGGASDRICRPEFPHALNLLAPASSYFAAVLRAIAATYPNLRTVSLLHVATGFGREVARGAMEAAAEHGMEVQTLDFTPGHAAAATDRLPRSDVLLVVGPFADEQVAAGKLLDRPWRIAAFVGAGVEEVLAPLRSAREGLLGPCQWVGHATAPTDELPEAAWFVRAYQEAVGGDPPYPAAAAFAAGVLCARCLRDTGTTDDDALLEAASGLSTRTLFGPFRLDPTTGLQVGQQILVVQWQQGVRRIVWPLERAERPLMLLH